MQEGRAFRTSLLRYSEVAFCTFLHESSVSYASRLWIKVNTHGLIGMLMKEHFLYTGNFQVAVSRPCVYCVFSSPVGGLAPREDLCVCCLRCTLQYPRIVQIHPNPERQR